VRVFRFWVLFLAVAASCVSGVAFAEPARHVRFEYARQEGAFACPELPAIEAGVAARLGYEPFDDRAPDLVRTSIRGAAHGLEARIELVDGQGTVKAERRLVSHQRDCTELASSVELAVSIAIDPLGVGAAEPAANPPAEAAAPQPSPAPAPGPPAAPAPAEPTPQPRQPLTTRVEGGLVGTIFKAPGYSLGARAGGSLGGDSFSLGLEGQADFSARKSLQQGSARATLWTASLVPCARQGVVAACALVTAGLSRGSGEGLEGARSTNLFYAALGLRLSLNLPLTSSLALTVHGDASAPLVEEQLRVDQQTVWTSPHVSAALGVGLAATFP
jgi:hypothetical protein